MSALSQKIRRRLKGADTNLEADFECTGISIVNGAQTVGAIGRVLAGEGGDGTSARVMIRLVSLENSPTNLSVKITKATNTQNRIDYRDFVTLDPKQKELRQELLVDRVHYAYRSGEKVVDRRSGFDLEEATVAMACSSLDISLSVQAKGTIGKLWADTTSSTYLNLFPRKLSSVRLWHLVIVSREIEEVLNRAGAGLEGRLKALREHANRFVMFETFKRLDLKDIEKGDLDLAAYRTEIEKIVPNLLKDMVELLNDKYKDAYIANIFKNQQRCKELDLGLSSLKNGSGENLDLFPVA